MALGRTYAVWRAIAAILVFCPAAVQGVCQAVSKPATTPSDTNAKTAPAAKRVRVISDLSKFHLEQQPEHAKSTANEISAGTRGTRGSQLVLCAPFLGMTLTTRPVFAWKDRTRASQLKFTLLTEEGDVLYEEDVAGSSWKYPDTAAVLEPGKSYRWKIASGGMEGLPDPAKFQVLDESSAHMINQQLGSMGTHADPLARAQVFLEAGLWYDTVATLQSAIQENPNRKDLAEQLQILYEDVAPACGEPLTR